jgi:GR25 family glycosyltransferase involved in LPS biosynthesis
MRINVISLERTPERLAEFQQVNSHLKNVEIFKGVDGADVSIDDLASRGIVVPPIQYSKGALGCLMSHISLWDRATTASEILTIGEDDAIFHRDFERRALGILAALPDDTDIVYWGWNFDASAAIELVPGMAPCSLTFGGRNPLRTEIEAFQNCMTEPKAYRILRAFGTVCYTVTPRGARRLRELCLPVRDNTWDFPEIKVRIPNIGVDVAIANAMPQIRAFCSFPPIAMSLNEPHRSTSRTRAAN